MNTNLIRDKIKDGTIQTWQDVYGYCTPKEMSERLGRGPKYWESVRYRPLDMTLGSVFKFIEEVGISRRQFDRLGNNEGFGTR